MSVHTVLLRGIISDFEYMLTVGEDSIVGGCTPRLLQWCNVTATQLEAEAVGAEDVLVGWEEVAMDGVLHCRIRPYQGPQAAFDSTSRGKGGGGSSSDSESESETPSGPKVTLQMQGVHMPDMAHSVRVVRITASSVSALSL